MTILFTAVALAAAPVPAVAQPAASAAHAMHAQQAQPLKPGAKPQGEGCSCCKGVAGGAKMSCCAMHGKGHDAEHSGQSAKH